MASEMEGGSQPQTSSHALASLYQRYVLDSVVEAAHNVSHDFVRRPRHYRAIPEKVADTLESFRIRTGSDPEWLSAAQRAIIFSAIFDHTFSSVSSGLRAAATAYVNRSTETNMALLQRVRDEAAAFRAYLKSIDGRVVAVADKETRVVFQSAVEVIESESVAGVFGLSAVPTEGWLLAGLSTDDPTPAAGVDLVAEIQRSLGLASTRPTVTHHQFFSLQRTAYYGARTIAGVLDEAGGQSANHDQELANDASGWEHALQAHLSGIDVIRAWKDPQYRRGLSLYERTMMAPHPSGEVGLKGAESERAAAALRVGGGRGYSTWTNNDICCSTGDLSCETSPAGTNDYKCTRTSNVECGTIAALRAGGGRGYSTQTNLGICCSTGDLYCGPLGEAALRVVRPLITWTVFADVCCSTGDLSCAPDDMV